MNAENEHMTEKLRIGIVEDHAIFRKRLIELLSFYDNLEVTIASDHGQGFLDRLEQARTNEIPHIVLMDIELPGISGIDTTIKTKEQFPEMDVIMFTVFEDDERIFDSIKAGACGYLLKDTGIDEVVQALFETRKGGSPITPSIARKLMGIVQQVNKQDAGIEEDTSEAPFELSPGELRILELVVEGKSNKVIAENLFLSQWTVKTHIRNIYKKMQVSSRASAVRLAMKRDLLK